jgi:hypothetical protein
MQQVETVYQVSIQSREQAPRPCLGLNPLSEAYDTHKYITDKMLSFWL